MTSDLPFHLLLPLAAGLIYVVAALLLKRAAEGGIGPAQTTRICNTFAAVLFAPLWLLGGHLPEASLWWQPAVVAFLFFLGQLLTMMALRIGDVSITTPVLGLKIILVAAFTTWLLGQRLSVGMWMAAALSSVGVGLLHLSRPGADGRVGTSILLAGSAAVSYALFDVLVQKWAPAWGPGRFLPLMMGCAALYSLPLPFLGGILGDSAPSSRHPSSPSAASSGKTWVWAGAACLAVQAMMLVSSIAIYRHAPVANVLYSSRGLWSVVLVWMAGHWFQNRERHHGAGVLGWRLVAASLLMIAIVLAMRSP